MKKEGIIATLNLKILNYKINKHIKFQFNNFIDLTHGKLNHALGFHKYSDFA